MDLLKLFHSAKQILTVLRFYSEISDFAKPNLPYPTPSQTFPTPNHAEPNLTYLASHSCTDGRGLQVCSIAAAGVAGGGVTAGIVATV